MTTILRAIVLFFFILFSSWSIASDLSPIGNWKTIDDVTGKTRSILKISKSSDHTLVGEIVKIFPNPGETENQVCSVCKGANYNKPIVGLMIMWGLKEKNGKWSGGHILDPKTGKIYRIKMEVFNNGAQLKVHGYIGVPLLGKTQIWERTL